MRLPGWALIPMARALERQNKTEDTGIPRRIPGEDTGSYCSDAATGAPGATRSGKRQEGVSPHPLEGVHSVDALMFDLEL